MASETPVTARDLSASESDQNDNQINDRARAASEALFFSIGEGAIVIDERGKIARVNEVALNILGYKAKDLIGKWYPGTVVAEDENGQVIPNMERPVIEVFLSGKSVFKRVYYRKKDGSRVPVALTVSPVILQDKPIGAIEIFRDITEELQLEHAKDEFISIASHQLRTPATVVKQYLGMVIEGYVDSEEQKIEMLKLAYEHNDNQLDIINDLLKVAQVEANKINPIRKERDLVKLLNKVISSQMPDYAKKQMTLSLESSEKSVLGSFDPLHIQMVFENLINNAYKYSPKGSSVTIRIIKSPKNIIVKVKDAGIGISAKDIPKLFNKFSRIENINSTVSGTGLGLYWAKRLVELHGGEINVSSVPGQGTTFSVKIPREIPT